MYLPYTFLAWRFGTLKVHLKYISSTYTDCTWIVLEQFPIKYCKSTLYFNCTFEPTFLAWRFGTLKVHLKYISSTNTDCTWIVLSQFPIKYSKSTLYFNCTFELLYLNCTGYKYNTSTLSCKSTFQVHHIWVSTAEVHCT